MTKSVLKNRIKAIRKTLGITQTELAEALGCSLQMAQYIENGQRELTPKWLKRFQDKLGIEPWMLFVDPTTIITDEDRIFLAKYHAASEDIRREINELLK